MIEQNIALCIDLILYGLEQKEIEFKYTIASIEHIDKITYSYKNEGEFFERKKSEIIKRILANSATYDIKIRPIDIEMGENKIYIRKEDRKIHPLFQEIKMKEANVKLEDLIKKRMFDGNLYQLYLCDKKRKSDSSFESIFEGCATNLLERIELDLCSSEDIEYIWDFFKTKHRLYSIMRLLLLKAPLSVMEEKFVLEIPLVEKMYSSSREEGPRLERYRYPYNDD